MTFRPNDLSSISPGNPGYRTFDKKIEPEKVQLPPRKSVFMTEHDLLNENIGDTIRLTDEDLKPAPATGTASELTITIRDEERSLKSKHLLYDDYKVNSDDPIIKEIIANALQEFNAEPTAIRIRISLVIL